MTKKNPEKIIVENFPDFISKRSLQVHEAQENPRRKNTKKKHLNHSSRNGWQP